MIKSLHCFLTGEVQGVNLGDWIYTQAENLGVKGWVRSLHDGRLEIIAQGSDELLEEFKTKLAQGSTLSRITNIETTWTDYEKEFAKFEFRR